ncbi:MAG TPA: sigma-70 family RNA polymerase sigma factor [Phycisphaerae bacterium]|nr:sigma-70 family RNA polymerase sigma factor [Phycisphaerae bacterium]
MPHPVPSVDPPDDSAAPLAPDDTALMRALAEGDSSALRALYDRHAPVVYALARRMLHDTGDAEQLLIDVFFELWNARDRYDQDRAPPLPYILRVTRSRALDRLRKRLGPGMVSLDPAAGIDVAIDDAPGAASEAGESAAMVRAALGSLDPEQRRALECAYFDGLSHSQIAQRLNKPVGTVKSHIRLGMERLRQALRNTLGKERGTA